MDTCVIGYGMVGKATADVFGIEKHFDVHTEKCNITLQEAAQCQLVFICLPTPVDNEGNYDVQPIRQIIREIEGWRAAPIYVIRSTVFPGFAENLMRELNMDRIVSNPEFLSEATAVEDMKNPPFVVLGGLHSRREQVKAFYSSRLKDLHYIETDNKTAEMIKLTMNAFFATKVIFANQAYDACQSIGANYEQVKDALERHPYGPKNHFEIWFKEKRGVNGHCLPKDSKAFVNYTGSELVRKVVELNGNYITLKFE